MLNDRSNEYEGVFQEGVQDESLYQAYVFRTAELKLKKFQDAQITFKTALSLSNIDQNYVTSMLFVSKLLTLF